MHDNQFETILGEERARLVRLCAWFSGDPGAAEDLAQETLAAAWKSRDQLTSPDKLKPWAAAIARNVCLNWSRQHHREQRRLLYSIDSDQEPADDFPDGTDLELELDRSELARLLDQALSLLPAATARILVEHYIQQSSHTEIAEIMQMNPGTVAVRLQRGKLTLQKLLRSKLHAEASAFGLIDQNHAGWEETNIWCPNCGAVRLQGKYQTDELFALRCPKCDPEAESIMAGLDLSKPYHASLLGNTRTYKPAYARLLTAFIPLYQQALRSQPAPCLACGKPLRLIVEHDRPDPKGSRTFSQLTLHCQVCGWASNKSLAGFVIASSGVQRFWREHPRMRTCPAQEIEVQGIPAWLTRLESVTSAAELTVISRRDTFEPIEVHTKARL